MNKTILNAIAQSITEQLNSSIEDIVMSVMETHLECHDFETQYDAAHDAIDNFEADISELAENIRKSIRTQMTQRLDDVLAMVVEEFTEAILPSVIDHYEQDGEIDGPARREAWCNYIDFLSKSDRISEDEAANIDFDVESL
jgi:t-SNARE complex subunit (syntaxin)